MKFTYVGDEGRVEIFGLSFDKNVPVEVSDAHALTKLPNHPEFIGEGAEAKPRRGRPPKVKDEAEV